MKKQITIFILIIILTASFGVYFPHTISAQTFLFKFGEFGTGNGQFDDPEGIAVDSSGNIYVADTDNNCVQKFNSASILTEQTSPSI